ncbi:hypothetical protein G9A89_000595, partial [Geosiphon pyriformis]
TGVIIFVVLLLSKDIIASGGMNVMSAEGFGKIVNDTHLQLNTLAQKSEISDPVSISAL